MRAVVAVVGPLRTSSPVTSSMPASDQCPGASPKPRLSTGCRARDVVGRMSGLGGGVLWEEGQGEVRAGMDSPQGQEEQEGSHEGCHGNAVAHVVDHEGDVVVRLVLPLLDRQTDTQADGDVGHVAYGAGHSRDGHPVCPDLEGRRGSECHRHAWLLHTAQSRGPSVPLA